VLLRAGGLGLCFVLAATAAVAANWDLAVIAAVLAVALTVDLWRDLRPRQFVVAGPDLLVIHTPRATTTVRWDRIARVGVQKRRLRRARPVVVRDDGSRVVLPVGLPVSEVQRWLDER
jgi:hypothetical protein